MTIGEVSGSFGVCATAVRRWCKNGKFSQVIRTIGNQRRFDPDEAHEILHPGSDKRITVGYARVSSYDQRSDLMAQAERLRQYGWQQVISDLGSGLNCKKPGLKRLLKLLLAKRVGTLGLTYDDRLLRFGTELIYFIARLMCTRVVTLDEPQQQSFEAELVRDVITLMTVF